ncbi:MAG: hypothetical protein DDT26_00214 [Dehalococcoidia bacterium]|nr:hypothetical protein [Chloroflexota bacterium]
MPKLTLVSKKFPAINLTVPTIPGAAYGGSFQFHVGYEYTVTAETAAAIQSQISKLSPYVKNFIEVQTTVEVEPVVAKAPAKVEAAPPLEIGAEVDPIEDSNWTAVELNRLRRSSLEQGKIIVNNIATNAEQFSLEDRLLYLEGILADGRQKKGVQAEAEALKVALAPADPTDD